LRKVERERARERVLKREELEEQEGGVETQGIGAKVKH
jgi:hypothetical protein